MILNTQNSISYMRLLQLRSSMKLELESGIYVGRGIRPFNIAVEELGLHEIAKIDEENRVLNKHDVYNAVCSLDDQKAMSMMNEYAAKKKSTPPEAIEATGNAEEKIFEIFNGYFKVTQEQVINLLVSAFEGGSNYWYMIVDEKKPSQPSMIPREYAKYHHVSFCWGDGEVVVCDKEEYYDNKESIKPSAAYPDGLKTHALTEEKIVRGLEIMAQKDKAFWVRFALENDCGDADDGDRLLQYSLFGELVYG